MIILANKTKLLLRRIFADICYFSNSYKAFQKGKIVILMYHRVVTKEDLKKCYIQPGMYVRSDTFERQVKFLKRSFEVLSFEELLKLVTSGGFENRSSYCVITFDDGWLDNYINAYPILKKYGLPATIFLPTALIGTDQTFWTDNASDLLWRLSLKRLDRAIDGEACLIDKLMAQYAVRMNHRKFSIRDEVDAALESLKGLSKESRRSFMREAMKLVPFETTNGRAFLNWDEIRTMSLDSLSFGAHTSTHKILTQLSQDDFQYEINEPLCELRSQAVNSVPVFCYPNGAYNQEIEKHVRNAGYQAAVSTVLGTETASPRDLYALRRIGIHQDITSTIPLFMLRLASSRR